MMESKEKPPGKICIIGAGSSGIVAAKTLIDHGLEFDCYEKGSGIGGNWRFENDNGQSAAYSSLHINTSKQLMAYSDYPMPADYPDYPHHSQILRYFESYVDHFGVRPKIRFNTPVAKVERHGTAWRVTLSNGEVHDYRAVLVANGHHWSPRLPEFPGQFNGRTLHTHDYKRPTGFEGRRVLVIGIGNSAVDIASELSRVAAKTFLSTRRSAYILPKYAFGRPIDHFSSPLGSKLPIGLQTLFFKTVLKLTSGAQDRLGVPKPDHGLLQAHPTVSAELLHLVGHGKIKVKPNIERLDGDGVIFVDGSREEIDTIIWATGYQIRFPFLGPEIVNPEHNEVRLYRNVVHPEHEGLYFIGLVQPLGAVMPLAEAQSKWVTQILLGHCRLPDRATMDRRMTKDRQAVKKRYVKSDRHTIQVDFYPYLATIAKEMR